jgi:hypothetical protein
MANLSKEWEQAIPLSEWEEATPIDGDSGIPGMSELDIGMTPRETVELLPEVGGTIGGIGGGMLGAPGGVPGVLAGGTAGAFAGGAVGETGRELLLGEDIDPRRIAIEGGWQGGFELLGGALGGVIGKVAAPLKHRLTPGVVGMQRWLQEKTGKSFTSAMMTDHFLLDSLEKMSEKSLFGGQTMQLYKHSLNDATDSLVDDFLGAMHRDLAPDEVGLLLQGTVNEGKTLFNDSARKLYTDVDRLVDGAVADLRMLKKWFTEEAKESMLKGVTSRQMGDALIESIERLPDSVTFAQAQKLRSELWRELSKAELSRDYAAGLAKKALALTDNAMERAAQGRSEEALKAWRFANRYYREGKELFNNKFIRQLAVKDPELLAAYVFQKKRLSNIRRVKNILKDSPETWASLKSSFAERIISDATQNKTGDLIGASLKAQYKKYGDDVMKEVWTPAEYNFFKNIAEAKAIIQKDIGGGGHLSDLLEEFYREAQVCLFF